MATVLVQIPCANSVCLSTSLDCCGMCLRSADATSNLYIFAWHCDVWFGRPLREETALCCRHLAIFQHQIGTLAVVGLWARNKEVERKF